MNRSSFLSLSFLLFTAACGGGSGGSDLIDGPPSTDPGAYRPVAPAGLGVAGLLDGTWRVTDVQLLPDDRTRNPDPDNAWLVLDEEIVFRDGIVFEEEGDPTEPPGPTIPVTVEFYVNQLAAGACLYGFGFRLGDNPLIGAGASRVCGIFGTTSATTATGVIVEEQIYPAFPTGPRDMFLVRQVQLEKVEGLPATYAGEEPGESEPDDAGAPNASTAAGNLRDAVKTALAVHRASLRSSAGG